MEHRDTTQETPQNAAKPRRNASATRQAILDSARQAFTRCGYDGVGVREIAQNAGVTAMLVNRYFGSKEKLFEEVVESTLAVPGILRTEIAKSGGDMARLSRVIAAEVVAPSTRERTPLDGILLLIRSASNPQAAAILRESARRHLRPLVEVLPGEDVAERAALFLSVVVGFLLMGRVIALPALADVQTPGLAAHLQALFTGLLDPKEEGPEIG
jgi:AcrR family transcriptional regulator